MPATQRYGAFEVIRELGSGATGRVLLARDSLLDRLVALKVLGQPISRALSADAAARREGRLLSRLDHPNVVTVYHFGLEEQSCYLAMEYVAGGDLGRHMAHGRLAEADVRAVVAQVTAALAHAHARGIVHRDVKPANILVAERPTANNAAAAWSVKVADFGLGTALRRVGAVDAAEAQLHPQDTLGQGALGEGVAGTPLYMAPEQARGSEVDARADVYALGVLTWELLAGRHPLAGRSALELLFAHSQEGVPPLPADAAADSRWAEFVARATEQSPSARFADAGEALAFLRAGTAAPNPTPTSANASPDIGHGQHAEIGVVVGRLVAERATGGALYRGEELAFHELLWARLRQRIAEFGARVASASGSEVVAYVRPHLDGDTVELAERTADLALAVRHVFETISDDPTLDFPVRCRAGVGCDSGRALQAIGWLDVPVLLGEPLEAARGMARLHAPPRAWMSGRLARRVRDQFDAATTEPGRHFELRRRWPRSADAEPAAQAELPFAGRHAELQTLLRTITATEADQRARYAVLYGAGGAGKTRFLNELEARTHSSPAVARCRFGAQAAGPFVAFSELVHELIGRSGDPVAHLAAHIRRLFPAETGDTRTRIWSQALAEALGWADGLDEPTRRDGPTAALDALSALLDHAAGESALVCLFDDAHAAGPAAQGWMCELVHRLADCPVVFLFAARPAQSGAADWLSSLGVPLDRTQVVMLGPLEAPEVAELAVAGLGASEGARWGEKIYEATGGHALFVEETIANLRETDSDALSRGLDDVILARLDRLAPEQKRALEALSLFADEAHESWVRADVPWSSLRAAGWVSVTRSVRGRPEGGRPDGAQDSRRSAAGRVAFRHALVRDAVYRHLDPRQRKRSHAELAEARSWADAPRVGAHHAEHGGLPGLSARYWMDAARVAVRRGAPDDARLACEAAWRQWESASAAPEHRGIAVEIVAVAVRAAALAGEPRRGHVWLDRLTSSGGAAEPLRPEESARVALLRAELAEIEGDTDAAMAALDAAEELLDAPAELLGLEVSSRRAMILARRGRFDEALSHADRALGQLSTPAAEHPDEPASRGALDPEARRRWHRAVGALHAARGHALCRTGRLDEGESAYQASADAWQATEFEAAKATAWLNLGLAAWWKKDLARARERWQQAARAYEAAGALHGLAAALINLGELELVQGRPETARDHLADAEQIQNTIGSRDNLSETLRLRAEAAWACGAADEARGHARAAILAADAIGHAQQRTAAESTLSKLTS